jgi:LL-diaminopimelate aminotransferase
VSANLDVRSERLKSLPAFLFNVIDDKKRAAIAAGKDVINLGVGDPDGPTPGFVVEELTRGASDVSQQKYPDNYGTKAFLAAVTSFMQRRFGVKVDASRHVCAIIGGKDGISHLPLGVLNPGEKSIVFAPAYPVYLQASQMAGSRVARVETRAEEAWLPSDADVSDEVMRDAKLMWLNYPGNPTGATITSKRLGELAARGLKAGAIVASDLAYSEVYLDGDASVCPSVLVCEGIDIEKDLVVEFHSLSKSFNMTGWRIGFAVGHESVIRALKQAKDNYDSGPFNAIQNAAASGLMRFDDAMFDAMRREYATRRDIVVAGLRRIGCEVQPPKAGIFVWARCPEVVMRGRGSWEFVERVIDQAAVVTVPGAGFAETASNYVRVSLTQPTKRIAEAMERLAGVKWA